MDYKMQWRGTFIVLMQNRWTNFEIELHFYLSLLFSFLIWTGIYMTLIKVKIFCWHNYNTQYLIFIGELVKVRDKYLFPDMLNLAKYIENTPPNNDDSKKTSAPIPSLRAPSPLIFFLYAVVVHLGQPESGHHYVLIRVPSAPPSPPFDPSLSSPPLASPYPTTWLKFSDQYPHIPSHFSPSDCQTYILARWKH